MIAEDDYVHFDVTADTAASLRLLDLALDQSKSERSSWKWAVVASHMAASTALVGYLTTTSGVGALRERSTKQLLDFYDSTRRGSYPDVYVAEFPALVARAAAGEQGAGPGGDPVRLDDLVERLEKLNSLRSRFNHFRDEGWSIQLSYIPPLLVAAAELVSRVYQHGWAFRHGEQRDVSTIAALSKRVASIVSTGVTA